MSLKETTALSVLQESKKLDKLISFIEGKFFNSKAMPAEARNSVDSFLASITVKPNEFTPEQVAYYALTACTRRFAIFGF